MEKTRWMGNDKRANDKKGANTRIVLSDQALQDPRKLFMVHDALARAKPSTAATKSPEAYLQFIVESLRKAAAPLVVKKFKPLKPWIRESTWQVLRLVAPIRRQRTKVQMEIYKSILGIIFSSWTVHTAEVRHGIHSLTTTTRAMAWRRQWTTNTKGPQHIFHNLACTEAWLYWALLRTQAFTKKLVREDRRVWKVELIQEAERASALGDHRAQWTLIKRLTGSTKKAVKAIEDKSGKKIIHNNEMEERWQEHFSGLLKAEVVESAELTSTKPDTASHKRGAFCPSVLELHEQISKLRGKKALGPDGIPNELLRVAGFPLAILMHNLVAMICDTGEVPPSKGDACKRSGRGRGAPRIVHNTGAFWWQTA